MWVWQPVPSTSVTGYSADCSPGSYGVSGSSVTVLLSVRVVLSPGSFSYTPTNTLAILSVLNVLQALSVLVSGAPKSALKALVRGVTPGVYSKVGQNSVSVLSRYATTQGGVASVFGGDLDALRETVGFVLTGTYAETGSPLLSSLALVRGTDQLVLATSGNSTLAGRGTTRDVLPPEIQITGNLSVPTVTLLRSVSSGVYTKTGALSGVHTRFVRGLEVVLVDSVGVSASALSSIALSAGFATYYHAGSSVESPVSIIRRMDLGLLSVSGVSTKTVWQLLRDVQAIPLGVEGVSAITGLGLAVPVANGIYLVVGYSGEVALISSAWILSPGSTVIEGSIVRSLSSLQRELAVGQADILGFNAILRRLFAAVVNLGLYTYSGIQADASVVEGWYLLPGSLLVDGRAVLSSLAIPRNTTAVSFSATGNETALSLGHSANLTYSAYVCDGHTVFSVSDRRIPVSPGSVLLVPRSLELVLIYPTLYPVVTFKAKKKTLALSGPVLTRKSRPPSQRRASPPEVKKAGRKGMLPS